MGWWPLCRDDGSRGDRAPARRAVIAALALGGAAIALPGSAAAPSGEGAMSHARPALAVHLPETVDGWSRPAPLRRIEAAGIFDYMDGAGELYLAYRFDHLDVAEYASPERGEILVELYWMRTSDDAYGLLSGDWGGEPVALKEPAPDPGPRALYGAGLLRLWSDDLYARVLATRESEAARRAVLALGRAIVAGRRDPPPPRLATSLPQTAAELTLRPDSVCFLRSHLVLNSAYFVSQRDILNLGPNVEAVTARYGNARLVLVRYPERARRSPRAREVSDGVPARDSGRSERLGQDRGRLGRVRPVRPRPGRCLRGPRPRDGGLADRGGGAGDRDPGGFP